MTETYSKGNPLDRLILPRLWKPDESPLMLADNELNRKDDLKIMKSKYRHDSIVQKHTYYVVLCSADSGIGYVSEDLHMVNSTDLAKCFPTESGASGFLDFLSKENKLPGKLSVMPFCDSLTHKPVSRKKTPLSTGISL